MFWNIEFTETQTFFFFFFPAMIGNLLLWFGKEAMSTLAVVIKEFRETQSFLLHCSATEGDS